MDIYFIEVGSFSTKTGVIRMAKGGTAFFSRGRGGGGLFAFKLVKNIHG